MMILGTLQTGLGRGSMFISMKIYADIFKKHLGGPPFHGTLNLEVSNDSAKMFEQCLQHATTYDNLKMDGKEMGGILILPITLKYNEESVNGVCVRPLRTSHMPSVLEIVACEHLRELWNLKDGDKIEIHSDFN